MVSTDPLAVCHDDAARLLDISPAHLSNLRAAGRFGPRPIRMGRSVRFDVAEIRAWLAAGGPTLDRWGKLREEAR